MSEYPIYRIVKCVHFRRTKEESENYFIEVKKKSFFFGSKWYKVKDRFGDVIYFLTETEAVFAVKNLQMGNMIDGVKREVTVVLDFNR